MSSPISDPIEEIKQKITSLPVQPVSDHAAAYEEIHGDLQRALSEIEGL
jgi:hypothetical protein